MNRSHLSKKSSGVALIIVLWAVSLIATAMLGLAVLMERQIGQEVAALQNARAMLVAESGIQMVLNPNLLPEDVEAASLQLSARLQEGWKVGKTTVPVKYTIRAEDMKGEGGKVNINALLLGNKENARAILQNLFAKWEVNLTTSNALIDALLDWVDADQLSSGSNSATEVDVRNGPFEKIDELEKVVGWTEMAKEAKVGREGVDAIKKFTVFGTGKLSLRSADKDVIEAFLGLPDGKASDFITARKGQDGVLGTQDDVVNQTLLGTNSAEWADRVNADEEDLWRVTSTGSVGEATRKVVALISRKTNPPQVKARWTDEESP
jgi:type II secretory pathway component PulK